MKAFEDYKKSTAFKEEVIEALAYIYEYVFDDCKAKVIELFLGWDSSKVVLLGEEANVEATRRVKFAKKQLKKSQRRKLPLQ